MMPVATDSGETAPRVRRSRVLYGVGAAAVLMLVALFAFSGTQRLSFFGSSAGPVVPGETLFIPVPEGTGGDLPFWFEQAPLGRWYLSHDRMERVADSLWDRQNRVLAWSGGATIGEAQILVTVPLDAKGSAVAVCDISYQCYRFELSRERR